MKRRKFIRNTAIGTVSLPGVINGFGITAHGENSILGQLHTSTVPTDHVLVVVQMSGGNDGLNTVIPRDQYSNYFNARSNIAIAENKILALTGNAVTGLHPSLTGFRDMYNNGDLCIVQSAGYPTPNFSHFRATDIWMTASNSNEFVTTGWLGRYLNGEYPGFPTGYPNVNMPDPLGIQFGSGTSLAMLGPTIQTGYTISDPNAFINNADGGEDPITPGTPAADKLLYVRDISRQSQAYYNVVKNAYNLPGNANLVTYPSNSLANQLKIVARLINGGLKTKIYVVSVGGFDTHSAQVNTLDTSTGAHANLMATLGNSIQAFHNDLKLMNKDQRVLGMTFSEFGRRVKSNASVGTDHGYGAPMFVFGTPATAGVIGANPILPAVAGVNDNLPMVNDFRDIYWSIMKRWLCQDVPSLNEIMIRPYTNIDVCSNVDCGPGISGRVANEQLNLVKNFPNPVEGVTKVEFKTDGGTTVLQLMGQNGLLLENLLEHKYDRPKTINIQVDMSKYKPGLYYLFFQNGSKQQMKPIIKN
jgi:uncharacterized protein (DUF1501 family)